MQQLGLKILDAAFGFLPFGLIAETGKVVGPAKVNSPTCNSIGKVSAIFSAPRHDAPDAIIRRSPVRRYRSI